MIVEILRSVAAADQAHSSVIISSCAKLFRPSVLRTFFIWGVLVVDLGSEERGESACTSYAVRYQDQQTLLEKRGCRGQYSRGRRYSDYKSNETSQLAFLLARNFQAQTILHHVVRTHSPSSFSEETLHHKRSQARRNRYIRVRNIECPQTILISLLCRNPEQNLRNHCNCNDSIEEHCSREDTSHVR